MIKILESMKRVYLFFCFVVITVCRIYAADVTYIFSDAAAEKGIILDSEWTTDSIDEYSYWKATKGGSYSPKYKRDGFYVYKKGTFTISSKRKMLDVTIYFAKNASFNGENISTSISLKNDTTYTWTANHPAILKQLEITYLTEEQDSIVDTPLGEEYQGVWTLVTDMSQLSVDSKIIIAAANANKALSTLQNPKNRASVDIIKSSNKDTLMVNRDVQIITLELGAIERTWAFSVGDMGYLYASSSSENQMKTQSHIDANASWVIILSDSGIATIQAMGSNTHCFMKYNSGFRTFACFAEKEANIVLYGKDLSSVSTAIIESVILPSSIKKAIRNNRVVILRNGLYYNMLGQLVE